MNFMNSLLEGTRDLMFFLFMNDFIEFGTRLRIKLFYILSKVKRIAKMIKIQ